MKKKLFTGTTAALCLLATLSFSPLPGEEVDIEEIMAKVGNNIITRSDCEKRKQQYLWEMRELLSEEEYEKSLKEIDRNVLQDLINEMMVEYRARELSITIPDEAQPFPRMPSRPLDAVSGGRWSWQNVSRPKN